MGRYMKDTIRGGLSKSELIEKYACFMAKSSKAQNRSSKKLCDSLKYDGNNNVHENFTNDRSYCQS